MIMIVFQVRFISFQHITELCEYLQIQTMTHRFIRTDKLGTHFLSSEPVIAQKPVTSKGDV